MAHSDGTAKGYREINTRIGKKSPSEKRVLSAIRKTEGVSVNFIDDVLMDERFLEYAVGDFKRYVGEMEAAVQRYHAEYGSDSSKIRRKGWLRRIKEHWFVRMFT
ncbi:hypothetical protein [Pseudomonas lundensis]|uniref:hypothetical protein n=1 Tax=Pseudomonas lundensis TaxID=86185 RepID=UPI0016430FB1|nr:hypothetical protein [Pseudomonas lundensis]